MTSKHRFSISKLYDLDKILWPLHSSPYNEDNNGTGLAKFL
jgi:hypothetical protein